MSDADDRNKRTRHVRCRKIAAITRTRSVRSLSRNDAEALRRRRGVAWPIAFKLFRHASLCGHESSRVEMRSAKMPFRKILCSARAQCLGIAQPHAGDTRDALIARSGVTRYPRSGSLVERSGGLGATMVDTLETLKRGIVIVDNFHGCRPVRRILSRHVHPQDMTD
jgi:hypothetical protein